LTKSALSYDHFSGGLRLRSGHLDVGVLGVAPSIMRTIVGSLEFFADFCSANLLSVVECEGVCENIRAFCLRVVMMK
jgi:hypothetical protein